MTDPNFHVVLGAGPLGRAVMTALLARGRRVRVVNRSGRMAAAPTGVEVVRGDVTDPASVRALTAGAGVVFQCAQPEYHEWPEKFPPLIHAVLDGLAGGGARLIFGDNLYMYGDPQGQPIHEGLPWTPHTRKGRARAQVAQAVLAAHSAGRVPAAIGRASDFFGPWVRDSLYGDRVFPPALAGGTAQLAGNLDAPHTASFIDDFGAALAVLGEREEALGQVWHIPNDQPRITQREFMALVAEAVGRPIKTTAITRPLMALAGLFIPGARETVEMMYEFEKPFVVDSGKFERTFGMTATPLPVAIEKTLAWYRAAHPPA